MDLDQGAGDPATADFEYDDYGNLIADKDKEIKEIFYNHLNLPVKIIFDRGGEIDYFYDASGTKMKKEVSDEGEVNITEYMDGLQYTNSKLDFFPHAEGYIKAFGEGEGAIYQYVFTYKDHLGNIRLKYTEHPQTGETEILEENHYYPYGLTHQGYNGGHLVVGLEQPGTPITLIPVTPGVIDTYKYKFGGKEYQDEFDINTYDFGARNYDPALGRWMNVDPLAEMMRRHSPYNYAFNNPVFFIDPDGNAPENCLKCPPGGTFFGLRVVAGKIEEALRPDGTGFRIWGSGSGSNSTRTEGLSSGPTIDLGDLPTVFGPRRLKVKGDGKTDAVEVFKTFANNFGQGTEAGQRVDDAVESVNKIRELDEALNISNSTTTKNEDMVAYEFDFWKNGEPHGGGDGAIGEEAAVQRKNELQKQFPDLDITIRPVDQPHPHHKKNEKE